MKGNPYLASDLYQLSIRAQWIKQYVWIVSEQNNIKVIAFTLNTESEKNTVVKFFWSHTNHEIVTKILWNKYVVGLLWPHGFIEWTLMFWTNKTILEDFNKKISSPRYQQYFDDVVKNNLHNTNTSSFSNTSFDNEYTTTETNNDKGYEQFTLEDLINNPENSSKFITSISKASSSEKIKNLTSIMESLSTLEKTLEVNDINTPQEILDSILRLKISSAISLQEKAVDIQLRKLKQQNKKD